MTKVMVFGVFDGVHEGHRALFHEAKRQGDYLIAVVAQDHIVEHLKGHLPARDLGERLAHLKDEDGVDEVVVGDDDLGVWGVVKRYRPNVIALGYDQEDLRRDLEPHVADFDWRPEIRVMPAHEPDTHHSSLLGRKD